MFGAFHEAQRDRTPCSVLLCGPFGQEAIRTHRVMRLVAERLARNGFSTMRFDYFGTGDSDGNDTDCSLAGCVRDTQLAHRELARRTLTNRVVWVGTRLGANIAIKASAGQPWPPKRLVLWEPIVDGKQYISGTLRQHHDFVRENGLVRSIEPNGAIDMLGFAMSKLMREEVEALDMSSLIAEQPANVTLLAPSSGTTYSRVADGWRVPETSIHLMPLDHDIDWSSEEAMNSALAPANAVSAVVDATQQAFA